MPRQFSSELLEQLASLEEVDIEPAGRPRTTIWIVVAEGDAYVRSVKAESGKWYRAIRQQPLATLYAGNQPIRVRAVPATDDETNAKVSAVYLQKYAADPWAPPIVRDEVLPTTLRLEPA
jgi:hypothetical protein